VDWRIKRALLSVYDKTGIIELARALHAHGCELVSTGGTGRALTEAGLPVTDISKVTGNPEAFGGRMKTISFAIESAILFDRERDREEAASLGIEPIDMVICNLYPFAAHRDAGSDLPTLIENIDIGGPTMIRAAAKNYAHVAAVCDPSTYAGLMEELEQRAGALSLDTRRSLMTSAFNHTADYDAMISETLDERTGTSSVRLAYRDPIELRYGENSHQTASFLRGTADAPSLYDAEILGGKPLSYNNIVDLQGALEAVRDLERHGCAVIKHTNPCGLSESDGQPNALRNAWSGDPVSAYGSVIAFNTRVDRPTVEFLGLDTEDRSQRKFVEVVVAPAFTQEAVDYLRQHESLRILRFDPRHMVSDREVRILPNACLVQTPDDRLIEALTCVTVAKPWGTLDAGSDFHNLLLFGVKAVRQVKSNAIVIVERMESGDHRLLGMGAGQPNRVVSTKLAVDRARATLTADYQGAEAGLDSFLRDRLARAILVSGAFFPFPDSIETAAAAGVRTFVQPGGSIRDELVIERTNELGAAMITTGMRHFKH